ncbi:sensor histidine kinase [Pararhodonellum marinum]|uniref:sensor histidine kinase n=1 Tax=Pararhodonellum marinum TaxID=2755358 RepID=UPI00188FB3CF|nr:histidine kinase [Pararhodonellum marinum]
MQKIEKISKTKIYWLLQVLGWSSMSITSILNQKLLLESNLDAGEIVNTFVFGFFCLGISHFYRKWFIPSSLFERPYPFIFFKGLQAIVVTAGTVVLIFAGITYWFYPEYLTFTYSIVQFINYGTYFGAWITIYFFFKILERNKQVIEEKLLSDAQKKQAELELLKSQLKPEFLFKSLESIKSLAMLDKAKARDTLIKLSELLRFSLNYQNSPLISLQEEMQEVEKYLMLEKICNNDQLNYKISMDIEALGQSVPSTMVFTMAENAVNNGMKNHWEGGELWINAFTKDNHMHIQVDHLGNLAEMNMESAMIDNIRQRLEKLFGREAYFHFLNFEPEKVRTVISYPLQKQYPKNEV